MVSTACSLFLRPLGVVIDSLAVPRGATETLHFITHAHADHLAGSERVALRDTITLCASQDTADLLRLRWPEARCTVHPYDRWVEHTAPGTGERFRVAAINAWHMPGSVMWLFQLPRGALVLATGDFRLNPANAASLRALLGGRAVDHLLLDASRNDLAPLEPLERTAERLRAFVSEHAQVWIAANQHSVELMLPAALGDVPLAVDPTWPDARWTAAWLAARGCTMAPTQAQARVILAKRPPRQAHCVLRLGAQWGLCHNDQRNTPVRTHSQRWRLRYSAHADARECEALRALVGSRDRVVVCQHAIGASACAKFVPGLSRI